MKKFCVCYSLVEKIIEEFSREEPFESDVI